MAPPMNRTAIALDLLVFVGTCVFCVSTQAPLIQQDILKRCQDALWLRRIPIHGLSVDGRDVILRGLADSSITSARAKAAVEGVSGVRAVRTVVLRPRTSADAPSGATIDTIPNAGPAGTTTQNEVQELQARIDQVLGTQPIKFDKEAAVLTPESQQSLDKIVTILTQMPNVFCEIRGYDSHPRDDRPSWVLALQRALATEDYLESKGIADWRLSTEALQVGEGTEGRRTDRSVDLVVKAR